jgi:hypothetical protein
MINAAAIWSYAKTYLLPKLIPSRLRVGSDLLKGNGETTKQPGNERIEPTCICVSSHRRQQITAVTYPSAVDSTSQSLITSPDDAKMETDDIAQELPTGKRKLKLFEKEIPKAAQRRFYDWKVLFTHQLQDILYAHHTPGADLSMRLKHLGPSEPEAKLHLIFQCDAVVAKALRKFLAQKHVTDQFQSQFEYLIIARQPKRLADHNEPIHVYSQDQDVQARSTLCGMPVTVLNMDGPATATIGGTLVVTTESRRFLCCMTAGHVVTRLFCSAGHGMTDTMSDVGNDSLDGSLLVFDESGEIELDLPEFISLEKKVDEPAQKLQLQQTRPLGRVIGVPEDTADYPTNLDWALIELEGSEYLPNLYRPLSSLGPEIPISGLETPQSSPRSVLVLSRRGSFRGTIRRQETSFLPVGADAFTVVYDLVLDPGAGEFHSIPWHTRPIPNYRYPSLIICFWFPC